MSALERLLLLLPLQLLLLQHPRMLPSLPHTNPATPRQNRGALNTPMLLALPCRCLLGKERGADTWTLQSDRFSSELGLAVGWHSPVLAALSVL